jgi:Zn-dependent peptidase ImmA (M78 family)/DNA-binding XRE family transcriptional regulator
MGQVNEPASEFHSTRLTLARQLRGYTKQTLAAKAGISTRSLTDFEGGQQVPSSSSQVALARALKVPVQFFHRPDPAEIRAAAVSFRALTRTTAREQAQAVGSANVALDLAAWIDDRFTLPSPDIPQYPGIDPEVAADALRAAWGLGEKPISNMVHVLEFRGVRVFSLIEECHEIDAFSLWNGEKPYIFFNTTKSAEHGRMDAAHELGHLVLHHDPMVHLHDRVAERDAQRFAGAFLMPERSVRARAPKAATLPALLEAKLYWKVALSGLVYRMHQLDLISPWEYRNLYVTMGSRGYLSHEPRGSQRETSQVVAKVLAMLREGHLTTGDIARDLCVDSEILNKLVFGLTITPVEGGSLYSAQSTDQPQLRLLS